LRIVAGKYRGRRLIAPAGKAIRPTADRVREAVFNVLQHGDDITGARVLDGFAGTGAMGLEAASRGALHVTLMDNHRTAIACCRDNVAALEALGQVTVLVGDCLTPVRPAAPCNLIFLDPPYCSGLAATALAALNAAGWIACGARCVIELAAKDTFDAPPGFQVLDQRRYGSAGIVFLSREA